MYNKYNASQLISQGFSNIIININGFDFNIILDSDYSTQPCMYVDSNCSNYQLIPNTKDKEFRKLSSLKKSIVEELNQLHRKLDLFKKNSKKAFKKYSLEDFNPLFDLSENQEEAFFQLKEWLIFKPFNSNQLNNYLFNIINKDTKLCTHLLFQYSPIIRNKHFNQEVFFQYFSFELIFDFCIKINMFEKIDELKKQALEESYDKSTIIKHLLEYLNEDYIPNNFI